MTDRIRYWAGWGAALGAVVALGALVLLGAEAQELRKQLEACEAKLEGT